MFYSNNCGDCCQPEDVVMTKADRKAILKEKAAILEAKLATVRHWIEDIDKEDTDKK